MSHGQTIVEKIATRHAVGLPAGRKVYAGDFVNIRPKHIMTHDNSSAVMGKFRTITGDDGAIDDPKQPVFAIDHDIQNTAPENLAKYAKIEAFAKHHGIDFHPPGTGICHQVMVEQGYVTPGSMVVGSDSHSNLYGAANALGTPVVRTDAACIWATGQTWWQVPPVARVELTGTLQPGVVGKDVIIALCGVFNHDEVLNMAVEFHGDGLACLSMDQRMSVANMTTEWGALAGVFPFDDVLRAYIADGSGIGADNDASYAVELSLDLSTVIPHVSGPDHVKVMHALPEIEKQKISIQKAYLLSCVNARLEDLAAAAEVLKGKKVADGVEMYVAAASQQVQAQAEALGHWQALEAAGADMLPSGCGPCIGLGRGTLESGEVCISATNRNFKGRMGARDAQAYLASPAVVAASAAAGYICAPTPYAQTEPTFSIKVNDVQRPAGTAEIIDGFPAQITGRALLLPVDNLNTDGIYSGRLTYRDDVTEQEMAEAAFANYDPEFNGIARAGDIVVAGRNFGTGSSREQAATCLAHRGLACVIAASFSQTYKRNAFNNGYLVIDSPALYDALHDRLSGGATIAGPEITLDFERSCASLEGRELPISPLSTVAQELIVAGGAERLVKHRLSTVK